MTQMPSQLWRPVLEPELEQQAWEAIDAIAEPLARPVEGEGGRRAYQIANQAMLHAYLGVAYATRSLSAPKPDDRTRLREKAVEQFKLAASAQPGYELSSRIVSPAIITIYNEARR